MNQKTKDTCIAILIILAFILGFVVYALVSLAEGNIKGWFVTRKNNIERVLFGEEKYEVTIDTLLDSEASPSSEAYPTPSDQLDMENEEAIEAMSKNPPHTYEPVTCIEIYQPVCGRVNIQCITTPCDPILQTFENSCFAKQAKAFDIIDGECEE
jgi:hypothetical protein